MRSERSDCVRSERSSDCVRSERSSDCVRSERSVAGAGHGRWRRSGGGLVRSRVAPSEVSIVLSSGGPPRRDRPRPGSAPALSRLCPGSVPGLAPALSRLGPGAVPARPRRCPGVGRCELAGQSSLVRGTAELSGMVLWSEWARTWNLFMYRRAPYVRTLALMSGLRCHLLSC